MNQGLHLNSIGNALRALLFILLIGMLPFLQACTWTVIPPEPTADPATVYLSVYGRHTRLALPDAPGYYVEYGFGDWRFYAEEKRDWLPGFQALFFSSGATLSRRELLEPVGDNLRRHFASVRTEAIEVPSDLANQLRDDLKQAWQEAEGEQIDQDYLSFRRAQAHYSLFNNSNHQTARWLEQLQCEVQGAPFWSDFEVVSKSDR